MIKFDTIKLLTKAKYIHDLNLNMVDQINNPNTISLKKPYNLFIKLKPESGDAIIEFSSKILLDDYSKLISKDTIDQCLEMICKGGFCRLDRQNIVADSKILSCDVTNDIDIDNLPSEFRTVLIATLKDVSKFYIQKYGKSGYTISKEVKTNSRKIRLSLYDKLKELKKASNKPFLDMLANPDLLMSYFSGKYRVEANFRTFKQICKYCQTNDNSLVSVLNSDANPLLKIFDAVFQEVSADDCFKATEIPSIYDYKDMEQLRTALVLRACNNDLKLVHELVKVYYSPKTNAKRILRDYEDLLFSSPQQSQNRSVIGQIRNKLNVA